jgi:hypothetical protein
MRHILALASLFLLAGGGTAAPARATTASSPYGINIHAPQGSDLIFSLDKVKSAGIGWVRIDFIWAAVQPLPQVWDWSVYDRLVAEARARGINVFATIAYTPDWASSGPEISGVPDDPATWREFCTRAAQRYRGTIGHWGIWNEPNLPRFWSGSKSEYLNVILKPGIAALRAGNPDAKIGGPDLAQLGDWYNWLKDTLDDAGPQLDFVTHHVYDEDGNRDVTKKLEGSTPFGTRPQFWNIVTPSVREVLKAANSQDKPFWLTETGWRGSGSFEVLQANYVGGFLDDWYSGRTGRDWVTRTFFYELQDSAGTPDLTWGLIRADRTEKPGFAAYRNFISEHSVGLDDAVITADSFPTRIEAGVPLTVRLTVKNTGDTTWTAADGYLLAADGDQDPFAEPRQYLGLGDAIAPGQSKTFSIPWSAPATPGSYVSGWQMLRDGVGRFGQTFGKTSTVVAGPTAAQRRLRLLGGRFQVEVSWRNNAGQAGFGHSVPGTDQTGYFWFFDAANVELVVKSLDGRPVNGQFWFFYGALSDVEYWVKVTDLTYGAVRTYYNPPGNLCGRGDTGAFRDGLAEFTERGSADKGDSPGTPAGLVVELGAAPLLPQEPQLPAATSCTAGPESLCLLGGRFQVQAEWRTRDGARGTAKAVSGSDQTGTFWFFDRQNVELVVKALDGRPVNGKFWLFYGALSDVEYRVTVTDVATGTVKQYYNAPGNLCGKGDTSAL